MPALLTKANIRKFCRNSRSKDQVYRFFGITTGSRDSLQTNTRYEARLGFLIHGMKERGELVEEGGRYRLRYKNEGDTPIIVEESSNVAV